MPPSVPGHFLSKAWQASPNKDGSARRGSSEVFVALSHFGINRDNSITFAGNSLTQASYSATVAEHVVFVGFPQGSVDPGIAGGSALHAS